MFDAFRELLSLAERAGLDTEYWKLPPDVRVGMLRATAEFYCYATNSRLGQAGSAD